MTNDSSSRQKGNLGGRFTDARIPAKVTITLSDESARIPCAQHLTWMLASLLARQSFAVNRILFNIPAGVPVLVRLSPLISVDNDFVNALHEGLSLINPMVVSDNNQDSRTSISIRVGAGPVIPADFSIATSADGWSGYVGQRCTDQIGESSNPTGAYIAAALSAGEVFKFARGMLETSGSYAECLWLNGYNFCLSDSAIKTPGLPTEAYLEPTTIAGVGAVANGFLHTLYAIPQLRGALTLIDDDKAGITRDNLERYVLFGLPHVARFHRKASTAAALFESTQLNVSSADSSWQEWYAINSQSALGIVISAVDKNSARHAIQDALPQLILGGATNDMRAQINYYDVAAGSACLKCRNPVEQGVPDDVIISNLQLLSSEELSVEAARMRIEIDSLEEFLRDPRANCGMIGGATLQKFAGVTEEPAWSVGFVSSLCGVLLAAEYLKSMIQGLDLALGVERGVFRFQFWRPADKRINTIVEFPAEATCICQTNAFRDALEPQPVLG
jgi:hypothetical protein